MSLINFEEIPGYTEAHRREQQTRDLAFCDWPVPLCGITANQFSLMHLLILGNCDNSFVSGRTPQPEDVALFLWVVSTGYRPNDDRAKDKFIRSIAAKVKFVPACAEIMKFMDEAFQDAPAGSGPASKHYTSFAAIFCDLFAHEYGWDDQQTMRKPVSRLFQLFRRISIRTNPKTILFNPSDRVLSEHLRASAAQN